MTKTVSLDLAVALLFALLSLGAILFLIPAGVDAPGSVDNAALSPAFWPNVIAWSTLAASLLLLVEAFTTARLSGGNRSSMGERVDEGNQINVGEDYGLLVGLLRAVFLIVVLFVFHASLERYGVVVPSIILLPFLMAFFGERNWIWIAILSLAIPLLLYGFFRHLAGISIPLGIFG